MRSIPHLLATAVLAFAPEARSQTAADASVAAAAYVAAAGPVRAPESPTT